MAGARLAVLIIGLLLAMPVLAQGPLGAPQWRALESERRTVLAPLADAWDGMSDADRNTWIGIADDYPRLTPDEQTRISDRMRRWADLTPEQREWARDQYRALRQLPPEQREKLREQWQQYRELAPEQRRSKAQGGAADPATRHSRD